MTMECYLPLHGDDAQAGSPAIAADPAGTHQRELCSDSSRRPQQQPQQVAPPSSLILPPVYHYRRWDAASKCLGDGDPSAATEASSPLLFSKKANHVYVLLEPIVSLRTVKAHMEHVYLAAPILVTSSCLREPRRVAAKSLSQGAHAAAGTGRGRPNGDVLFRPHPTKRVVVKRIAKSWINALAAEHCRGGPLGELAALRLLAASGEHPHVMPLIDTMMDDRFVYLVFPYADGGELFSLVAASAGQGLPEADARKYLVQVASGLQHLRRHGLAHGDVSLDNVMLVKAPAAFSPEGDGPGPIAYDCRLIDLGLCRRMPEPEAVALPPHGRLLGGKASYMAPEVADGTVVDWMAADVWSLAVCLYNLLTGMHLYSGPRDEAFALLQREGGARRILCHHIVVLGVRLSPPAAHLIAIMLHPVPAERPTLEEVLAHPWVANGMYPYGL